jgi:hypothetical protein
MTKKEDESGSTDCADIIHRSKQVVFGVNMTEAEMEGMTDKNGDICYNKNFEWMLSTFDGGKLF